MCEAQETMPRPCRPKGACSRCGGRALYVVRDLVMCRPCFLKHIHHRLGRTMNGPLSGSSRPNVTMRPPAQPGAALIALSGGAGSMALLDFLAERNYFGVAGAEYDITRGRVPPVWARAYAVHVAFPDTWATDGLGAKLREAAESRGLTYIEVRAADVYDTALEERVRAQLDGGVVDSANANASDNASRLDALLASVAAASRPTLLAHILDALLGSVAAALPVSHLLLGETATREAQRVIAGTAQGRGWSLPLDLVTLSSQSVARLRGARELSAKEAALYCHARGLESFSWRARRGGGIEALTERFVATLSARHPATVGAITRTASKLQFTGAGNEPRCPLCLRPADPGIAEWKARASLTALPGRQGGEKAQAEQLEPLLCYACATTLKGRKAAELPPYVLAEAAAQRPVSRDEMRAAIADCLL
ncbi:hypothetical protein CC85DRAFT_40044 [Cutaneotrichosporon oleaginosum]|uniref:Cytoplasmic tRNA 2-thiolation protein 2 n=1 Tax=Cutaneotrichosporon oleaginosum TaxID=879819 RepID=A0A0J0XRY3_9TREE|nr:uncharacterized protein CC85DRAFT_40044 [Cutaneotrichosporon oleaginosum]KLT43835.1 hypothetical protein CC85DRAFT_40044 [Cutaneotrichosporon oleaginosum]TXT06425.1 hypothetical protein COLE_05756 [Cutaneotrichosporon oleaginosum]